MLIHIAKSRYEAIRARGFLLSKRLTTKAGTRHPWRRYRSGDTEYHLMASDLEWCARCERMVNGLEVDTPAQLEEAKLQLEGTGGN